VIADRRENEASFPAVFTFNQSVFSPNHEIYSRPPFLLLLVIAHFLWLIQAGRRYPDGAAAAWGRAIKPDFLYPY